MEHKEIWPGWQYRKWAGLSSELRFRAMEITAPDVKNVRWQQRKKQRSEIIFGKAKVRNGFQCMIKPRVIKKILIVFSTRIWLSKEQAQEWGGISQLGCEAGGWHRRVGLLIPFCFVFSVKETDFYTKFYRVNIGKTKVG